MTILSVKLPDGTWVDIPAIVGPPGPSGVHIGTDTPPETANVWINPNGEPTGTEDWEFDLDDGSTDTKQVVVLNSDESSGQLAILRFRQADGTWTDIPAIKGDPGYTPQKGIDYFDGKTGDPGYTPVKGVDYNDGESGVYIGTGTPPDNANVWVNPTGEPTSTEEWDFDMDDGSTESKQVVVLNSSEATANGVLGILKVKQADGSWKEIPALVGGKGPKGDTGEVDYSRLNDYAKLASPNNMLHNGNEFTFIPDGYVGQVYINHRTASGQANGNVSNYYFGDGKGGLATFIAGYFKGKFQGDTARPIYNNEEAAMLSDVTAERAGALPTSGGTVNGAITIERANYPGFTLKNTTVNGDFAVTEADDGTALLQNNSDVTGANNYAALYIKPAETGINNFLQFGLSVNGAWSGGVILHSRNFTDHINPGSIGMRTENWTFTLEDGSTVTKAVYVG